MPPEINGILNSTADPRTIFVNKYIKFEIKNKTKFEKEIELMIADYLLSKVLHDLYYYGSELTPFEILGVPFATNDERTIDKAHTKRSKLCHPDRYARHMRLFDVCNAAQGLINRAYELLKYEKGRNKQRQLAINKNIFGDEQRLERKAINY